jgi:hypothetical protein
MFRCSLLLVALLPLAGGCRKPPLEEFASADLMFKARFPSTPKRDTKSGPFGLKMATYSVATEDGTCSVGVAELSNADTDDEAVKQDRLEGALEAAVRSYQATVKSRASITLEGKFQGREFLAVCGNSKAPVVRGRLFIINRRLYQVVVTGEEKYVMKTQGLEFLNSFEWAP